MALFKKKEDLIIPEVPKLPDFNEFPKEKGLPSLPGSMNEDLNRSMIKSAMDDSNSTENEDLIPSLPRQEESMNQSDYKNEKPAPFLESIKPTEEIKEVKKIISGPESIFVRIDKFKSAKKEISSIKKDLLEVEAIINKINEIKNKEDDEISSINLNLDNIKKKVGEVDSLVFDKI